jgi:hypothetical protein
MSRHLFAIFAIFLLGKADEVSACSFAWPIPSDEQLYDKASAVFLGHLIRTEEAGLARDGDLPPMPVVEGMFRVVEALKGEPPADGKVKTPVLGTVCMPLLPGLDYIVFLYGDNVIRGPGVGTRPILNLDDSQEKHRLEKLRDLRKVR